MNPSARLLQLLSLLQSRRFWSGEQLAEALEVTPRSVRRDIEKVRSLGYPVHATGGVGGGYSLGAGTELPPLPLDDDEAIAVAVGLRAAMTGSVGGLEMAALGALQKLHRVLPQHLRERMTALQAVSIGLPDQGPQVDGLLLTTVARACQEGVLLEFGYLTRDGERSQRKVEPVRLAHTRRCWYLVAWDRHRDAWRTFRVDRMTTPLTSHTFRPRPLPADDLLLGWHARSPGSSGGTRSGSASRVRRTPSPRASRSGAASCRTDRTAASWRPEATT